MEDVVELTGCHLAFKTCRVKLALGLKGVKYEFIENMNLPFDLLTHNGKYMKDSAVIIEYIEDTTWKKSATATTTATATTLFSQDPYERAKARFNALYIDSVCIPGLVKAFISKGEEQGLAMDVAMKLLKELEDELEGKKFFGGEQIGLTDIAANYFAYWLEAVQEVTQLPLFTKENYPKLYQWKEDFLGCPIVKETMPPRDALLNHFRSTFPGPSPN